MADGARVHQVNISKGGVPKQPLLEGIVNPTGLAGDVQAKPGIHGGPYRALSLFPLEAIQELAAAGHPISPGSIGENVTTEGLDWGQVKPNSRLRLGRDVVIEVTGYADPCKTIAGSFQNGDINLVNIRRTLVSRVYAKVIEGGVLRTGDPIVVERAGSVDGPLLAEAGVRRVTQVTLAVSDLDRSVAFYRDALGAVFLRTIAEWGLAFLDVGGTIIMLEGPAHHGGEAVAGSATVMFEVEDIDGSFQAMSGRGVAFDAPPFKQYEENGVEGWMAFLRDPDGNKLGITCRVPVSAAG